MFPLRLRRVLADLVSAADVVLAYETPPPDGARELAELADRHTLRRPASSPQPPRRPGAIPRVEPRCPTG